MQKLNPLRPIPNRIMGRTGGKSDIEESFLWQVKFLTKFPLPQREVRLIPERKWRFDFVWPDLKLVVEIEGGIWSGGRHIRPYGYEADCEKYNEATKLGYRVFRFTSGMIKSQSWIKTLEFVLTQT